MGAQHDEPLEGRAQTISKNVEDGAVSSLFRVDETLSSEISNKLQQSDVDEKDIEKLTRSYLADHIALPDGDDVVYVIGIRLEVSLPYLGTKQQCLTTDVTAGVDQEKHIQLQTMLGKQDLYHLLKEAGVSVKNNGSLQGVINLSNSHDIEVIGIGATTALVRFWKHLDSTMIDRLKDAQN